MNSTLSLLLSKPWQMAIMRWSWLQPVNVFNLLIINFNWIELINLNIPIVYNRMPSMVPVHRISLNPRHHWWPQRYSTMKIMPLFDFYNSHHQLAEITGDRWYPIIHLRLSISMKRRNRPSDLLRLQRRITLHCSSNALDPVVMLRRWIVLLSISIMMCISMIWIIFNWSIRFEYRFVVWHWAIWNSLWRAPISFILPMVINFNSGISVNRLALVHYEFRFSAQRFVAFALNRIVFWSVRTMNELIWLIYVLPRDRCSSTILRMVPRIIPIFHLLSMIWQNIFLLPVHSIILPMSGIYSQEDYWIVSDVRYQYNGSIRQHNVRLLVSINNLS